MTGARSLPGQRKEGYRKFRNPAADSNKKPTKAKMMQHSRGSLQPCSSSWLSEMATPCPTGPLGPINWQIWRSLNKTSASAEAGSLQKKKSCKDKLERRTCACVYAAELLFFQNHFAPCHMCASAHLLHQKADGKGTQSLKTLSPNSLHTLKHYTLCCQCEVTKENPICEIEQMILFCTWSTCMFSTWHAQSGVAWGAGGRNEPLDDIKKEWNVILASDVLYREDKHN